MKIRNKVTCTDTHASVPEWNYVGKPWISLTFYIVSSTAQINFWRALAFLKTGLGTVAGMPSSATVLFLHDLMFCLLLFHFKFQSSEETIKFCHVYYNLKQGKEEKWELQNLDHFLRKLTDVSMQFTSPQKHPIVWPYTYFLNENNKSWFTYI